MIYLDANASEPLRPAARAAMLAALDLTGNPSSIHAAGRAARRVLEAARHTVASAFGADPEGVVFTSGGTEANALAITGLGAGRRVLVSAVEHDAVLAAAPGAERLPVDADGVVRLGALDTALRDGPALVCVMLANNETGTFQPIAAIAGLCRAAGALLHVDAVQARGGASMAGVTSMAISSHKLGGPKGAGALLLAGADPVPALRGGGQERGRRGGTPALPSIAGFAAACTPWPDLTPMRDAVAAAVVACGGVMLGGAHRLGNTVCAALPGVRAETQVIALDLAGVQVSAGAACSSGKVSRSHVLDAMGHGALAGEAIRVSLPWSATWEDVAAFEVAYRAMSGRMRERTAAPSPFGLADSHINE